jgi:hypothetical protein
VPDTDTDGDGTPDCNDKCPNDSEKINPGTCGCGIPDADKDEDGSPDCNDSCPLDPDKTVPGTCGCGIPDTDTDGDGITDCNDNCPDDPEKTNPGICGCGVPDADKDGDEIPDCNDNCPDDAEKTDPGICGCGKSDADKDADGTADCKDNCPEDAEKNDPGICGCGISDADRDGDGTPDCNDACPDDPEKTEPGICGCGESDADTDGDGAPDCNDACPDDAEKTEPGICGCDEPDIDSDADGILDCNDACPDDAEKTAPGICGCDEPDIDSDADGILDCNDACPENAEKTDPGICGCDEADIDSDADGILDCNDGCPDDAEKTEPGICGCNESDADTDGDGIPDCNDGCPDDAEKTEPGICGCGESDADTDEDGIPDCKFNAQPDMPAAYSPENEEIFSELPVILQTSPFSDLENDPHTETQWLLKRADRVWNCADYDPVFDVIATGQGLTENVLSELDPGLKYVWKARYKDQGSGTFSEWSAERSFKIGISSQDRSVKIRSGTSPADFVMVSFTVWPDDPAATSVLGDEIGTAYNTKLFRIGAYDPIRGAYVEYGEKLEIEPGRAYWFGSKKKTDIAVNGVPVSLNHDIEVKLLYNPSIGDGWNMIGCPNSADYDWNDVEILQYNTDGEIIRGPLPVSSDENDLSDKTLWRWEAGEYVPDTAQMERNKGYWIRAKKENVFLRFPAKSQKNLPGARTMMTVRLNHQSARLGKLFTPAEAIADTGDSPPPPIGGFGDNKTSSSGGSGGCFIDAVQIHR